MPALRSWDDCWPRLLLKMELVLWRWARDGGGVGGEAEELEVLVDGVDGLLFVGRECIALGDTSG